ncbi:MAG TPA: DUF2207 domain-containing protein [Patescibacteria group bacterium]
MRKFFFGICVSLALFFVGFISFLNHSALAQTSDIFVGPELITSFHSDITINQDTSISIKETIEYVTNLEKHGIYRYIPIRYHRQGLNYTARVSEIEVTDEHGDEIPFQKSFEKGNVMLKIGDPDTTFTGQKTYVISYQVENAITQYTEAGSQEVHPELYWDITGEGWQIDISSSSATVTSPDATITTITCFSGVVGSDDGLCQGEKIDDTQATFTYPERITYGENMTVAVGLNPTNTLIFPTPTQRVLKQIRDNINLIPVALPGLIMLWWWWRKGRDKAFISWNVFNQDPAQPTITAPLWKRRHVPFVYEPIKELTPGEAGAMLNEKVDTQDIIAEIVDLARQKFLKIERTDKKKFIFLNDNEYQFTKLKKNPDGLPDHQKYLLEKIFAKGDVVKLSDLKGSFYSYMEKTKQKMYASLVKKGFFKSNPQTVKGVALVLAIVMMVLGGVWGIMLIEQGIWWVVPIAIVSDVVALVCALAMPAKTALGTNFAWQAKGLRQSIQYGAWREKIKEKHLFFEEVLPFAIALGVVDQLANDMEKLNVKPPQYLAGSGTRHWSTHSFVHSFTSQASSTLTYNPSSSSYGGSSSGGSSGGGGGGGGGGSW